MRATKETTAGRKYLELQREARRTGRPTDELIQLYALECFLDRLAHSEYVQNFVLKGGVLLAALNARRPTRDIDFAARAIDNDTDAVLRVVREIAVISLLVRTDVTPINSTVAIRGIGTSAFSIGVEPIVDVVVDDVPWPSSPRAFGNMTDISRVKILAGPQSTLYGKSSTAVLVNIVTPDPTRALSGKVGLTGTTDLERDVSASPSGPMTDTLAGRLSVISSDFSGTIKNLYTGWMSDGDKSVSAHGKLVWDPTSEHKSARSFVADCFEDDGGSEHSREGQHGLW
jgi:iron complex outermembrane recepter protein